MKKWHKELIWFLYFLSLIIAFEITDYFVNHNLLSSFYICLIEIMFLGLGNAGAYIAYKLNNTKKRGKK